MRVLPQAFEEVEPQLSARAADDLLDFSAVAGGSSEAFLTPTGGRAQPLSASSASWVEEMNAELAEFDAVIGRYSSGGARGPGLAGMDVVETELEAQLATPLDVPPTGPPPQPPR